MTAVISGCRWGDARRGARPIWAQTLVGVAATVVFFVGGLVVLPPLRAALRGHDLMSVAISADGLSKRYRIGELHGGYGTLRESIRACDAPSCTA